MLNDFKGKLNVKLGMLNKKERKKHVDDYEEVFNDKKECGLDEKQIMQDIDRVDEIADGIIELYDEKEMGKSKISIFWKYYNKKYLFMDFLILVFIILVSVLCFYRDGGNVMIGEAFMDKKETIINGYILETISALFYALPIYILLNYLFNLYKIRKIHLIPDLLKRVGIFVLMNIAISYGFWHVSRILIMIVFTSNLLVSMLIYSFSYLRVNK